MRLIRFSSPDPVTNRAGRALDDHRGPWCNMRARRGSGVRSKVNYSKPTTIAATIVVIVSGGGVFLILPMFVGALVDTGRLDMTDAGMVAAADLTGIFLASIAALGWIPRADWRRVALVSLVVMVAGNMACLGVRDFGPLLVLRGVLGLAAGNLMAIGMAHLARVRNPARAFALAIAAQVAFSTAALWLLPGAVRAWGLASLFGLLTLLSAVGLLAATRLVKGGADRAQEQTGAVSGVGHVFVALAANGVFFIAQSGVWAYLERIGANAGLASGVVGQTLALSVTLALAGPIAATLVADRYGRALPLAIVVLGQLVTLWMLLAPMSASVFLIAATGFQIFWNFAIPYLVAIVAALDRSRRYIVLVTPFQAAGIAAGPALAAYLAGEGQLYLVNYLGGAAVLASAVLLLPYALRYPGKR